LNLQLLVHQDEEQEFEEKYVSNSLVLDEQTKFENLEEEEKKIIKSNSTNGNTTTTPTSTTKIACAGTEYTDRQICTKDMKNDFDLHDFQQKSSVTLARTRAPLTANDFDSELAQEYLESRLKVIQKQTVDILPSGKEVDIISL